MIRLFLFTLTVLVLASVAQAQIPVNPMAPENCFMCPAPTPPIQRYQAPQSPYNSFNNYGADFYTPDYSTPPTPVPYNRHSLNNQPYDYSGMDSGADYCCDFSAQEEAAHRRAEQQHWLNELYQNAKPLPCGPAFDPRARAGC